MGKPISGVNKYPFGPAGIRVAAASSLSFANSEVPGFKYIFKQASSSQFKLGADTTGTNTIDKIIIKAPTADCVMTFVTNGVSFSVNVNAADTIETAMTNIITTAVTSRIEAYNSGNDLYIFNPLVGPESGTVITAVPESASIIQTRTITIGTPPSYHQVTRPKAIGVERGKFDLRSSNLTLLLNDEEIAKELATTPGSMAVRVWEIDENRVPRIAGFAEEFTLNNISVNTGTVKTEDVFVVGPYELVEYSTQFGPKVPKESKSRFFVESQTTGPAD